jgi:hypothetical protein
MADIKKYSTKDSMFSLIKEWQNSPLGKKHFCEQSQIGIHKFNYWLKKYKDEGQSTPSGFTVYRVIGQTLSSNIRLSFPNGVIAEMPPGSDYILIHQLIHNWQPCLP